MKKVHNNSTDCTNIRAAFIESIRTLSPDEIELVKNYALTLIAQRTHTASSSLHQQNSK